MAPIAAVRPIHQSVTVTVRDNLHGNRLTGRPKTHRAQCHRRSADKRTQCLDRKRLVFLFSLEISYHSPALCT